MEDLRLEAKYGQNILVAESWETENRDNLPGVFLGASHSEGSEKGGHYCRESMEQFNSWLTQWLKENPVKKEGWVNCFVQDGGEAAMMVGFPTKGEADSHEDADIRIACIPVSYHIGEGLEEENE